MDSGRDRVAPYVRRAARRKMRHSPQNPPPRDPPPDLRLPNPGLWRVWYYVWHAHQPDETGRLCRRCRRWYPCQEVLDAEDGFATLIKHARRRLRQALQTPEAERAAPGREAGRAPVFYPRGRNV